MESLLALYFQIPKTGKTFREILNCGDGIGIYGCWLLRSSATDSTDCLFFHGGTNAVREYINQKSNNVMNRRQNFN